MRMNIQIGADTLANPDRALPLEWVLSDGAGSYASSSVTGCNTRRYHGLLVAALEPPRDRAVLLSKLEEELRIERHRFELSTNEYPGALHPAGFKHLVGFRIAPLPEWTYAVQGGAILRKKIVPLRGRGAMAVIYRLDGAVSGAELRLTPMTALRGFHQTLGPNVQYDSRRVNELEISVTGGTVPAELRIRCSAGAFNPKSIRFSRMIYRRENERGLDCEDDLYSPGDFIAPIEKGKPLIIIASRDPLPEKIDIEREEREEESRVADLVKKAKVDTPLERALVVSGDSFIARFGDEGEKAGVIAGFPWFDCWGRDALIALEGLTLVTGRFDDARSILATFAERIRDGIIPNFLATEPENDAFNSIDAALWFVHAADRYREYTGDDDFIIQRIMPKISEIIESYARGTRYNIHADADGLISGGARDTQLTWMDASAGGHPVTPRHGKSVEINALWYNALRVGAEMAGKFGMTDEKAEYRKLADRVENSFNESFWDDELGCLRDGILPDGPDRRIRPNQALAVSLPHPVLRRDRWVSAMDVVRRKLLTPFGIRTLSPDEPEYCGEYSGSPDSRDGAYHQGTAWAWLLGPFWEGYLKAHDYSGDSKNAARESLSVISSHLLDAGLGSVSEIFDGDAPHAPRGCIAQAWSVAEIQRLLRLLR